MRHFVFHRDDAVSGCNVGLEEFFVDFVHIISLNFVVVVVYVALIL